jgi:uncharacterized membrane protein
MAVTVTHVYDDYESAQSVISDLEAAGFDHGDISMVSRHRDRSGAASEDDDNGAATGATLGGVVGAGAGLLASLGVIAIPGIGPLVAAGILATTLTGAAGGAVAGGLLGALVDYGVSEDDAQVYAESVRRGGTLVSVRAPDGRADEAERIMRAHDPIDIEERGRAYRETGWTSYDPEAPAYTAPEIDRERARYRSAGSERRDSLYR